MFISYGNFKVKPDVSKHYLPYKYRTGIKVKDEVWRRKTNPTNRMPQSFHEVNTRLQNLENAVMGLDKVSEASLKELFETPPDTDSDIILDFHEKFIRNISDGTWTTDKGTNYNPDSVKQHKSTLTMLTLYDDQRQLTFDDINNRFYESFRQFLIKTEIEGKKQTRV